MHRCAAWSTRSSSSTPARPTTRSRWRADTARWSTMCHGGTTSATPRNRSLDLASGEWILYIDADERVRAGDHDAVRSQLTEAADLAPCQGTLVSRPTDLTAVPHKVTLPGDPVPGRDPREHRAGDRSRRPSRRSAHRRPRHPDDRPSWLRRRPGAQARAQRADAPRRARRAARPAVLHDHLAHIYEDRGELERARATWRRAIEVGSARATDHPDDRLNWINLLVHAVAHDDPDGDVPELIGEAQRRYPGNRRSSSPARRTSSRPATRLVPHAGSRASSHSTSTRSSRRGARMTSGSSTSGRGTRSGSVGSLSATTPAPSPRSAARRPPIPTTLHTARGAAQYSHRPRSSLW